MADNTNTQLNGLTTGLKDLSGRLNTTSFVFSKAKIPFTIAGKFLKSPEKIEQSLDKAKGNLKAAEKVFNVLDKVSLTKSLAKVMKPVISRLEDKVTKLEDKLENLSEKSARWGRLVDNAKDTLKTLQIASKAAAAAADQLAERAAGAEFNLSSVRGTLDRLGDDNPIEGITAEARAGLKIHLNQMLADADLLSGLAATEIQRITDKFEPLDIAAAKLEEFLNAPAFELFEAFARGADAVASAFATIFGPLQKVYDAVGPVLDALGSIFGFILAPLEYALEAILEATGIQGLIDKLAAEIEKLLPDLDIGILDAIEAELTQIFDVEFNTVFFDNLVNPLEGLLDELYSENYPNEIARPTEGNDLLVGSFGFEGPETVEALGGDDLVIGGAFNDTLNGGAGADTLIGGPGDDTLIGGSNPEGRADIVIYKGSVDDYGIASILENGEASGTWVVVDYRDQTTVESTGDILNNGTDTLIDVEQIIFDDYVVPIGEIDTFIRTFSEDGKFAKVTPIETTLDPIGGIPQLTADNGIDRIFGGDGFDIFETGGGNDQLTSSFNGELTIDIQSAPGDFLNGGDGNDLFLIDSRSGTLDAVLGGPGVDSVNYKNSVAGVAVFLAAAGNAELYRPTSITFTADYRGQVIPGINNPTGVILDVENIEGSAFDDYLFGSDAINKINGGDGNDQIRGLDGDDILLGGDGNDILVGDGGNDYLAGGRGANEYVAGLGDDTIVDISSGFSIVKYSMFAETALYSQSVRFVDFDTTGVSELTPLNMPGGIVIFPGALPGIQQVSKYATSVIDGDRYGVDTLEGVDRIVGSIGDDVIYAALELDQTIYGNDGDDRLYSGSGESNSRFYGGPGDDEFFSTSASEDTFFGGSGSDTVTIGGRTEVTGDTYLGDDGRLGVLPGTDTIDFSASEFSWHIYLNSASGNGRAVGKYAQSVADAEDPRYIQPTLGINGVVEKLPGISIQGERYPGVPDDLRFPDPNTQEPGGRTDSIGEWDVFRGSDNRDIFTLGSPDGSITAYGNGGDDVLFGLQQFGDRLYGGDGNDILGTLNPDYSSDPDSSYFNIDVSTLLDGGDGDDLFVAGDYREYINGGAGTDEVTYEASRSAVSVDLGLDRMSGGYAEGDVIIRVENLTGSQFGDLLIGDGQANQLLGWHGDDRLEGLGSDDNIFGGDGDDELLGGEGNDNLHGGNGADIINGGAGNDTASWSLYQIDPKGGAERLTNDLNPVIADLETGQAGLDTLIDIENLRGGAGDDQLSGDGGDNALLGDLGDDVLDGRGGNDYLVGGEGDDQLSGGADDDWLSGGRGTNTLDGGNGRDTIDYGVLSYGVTVVMGGVGERSAFDTGTVSSFVPVDFFVWTDSLTTTAGPTGAPGDIIAFGTDETRYTYQVRDQGTDDPADDVFIQEDPITPERLWRLDPFFAQRPEDIAEVRYLPDALLPEQEITRVDRYEESTDFFRNIEIIAGSQGDDSFLGNAEDTVFYGSLGADRIDGGAGKDAASYEFSEIGVTIDLVAGSGTGGEAEGDELLNIEDIIGSAFGDELRGNSVNNQFTLGAGDDLALGGSGTDTVIFEFARADAIVQFDSVGLAIVQAAGEFVRSIDRIGADVEFFQFSDGLFSYNELAATVITGTGGNDTIIGTPVSDPISGGDGDDRIEGRAGGDTLEGDDGDDVLIGEEGDDRLIGGAGFDRFEGGPGNDTFVIDSLLEIPLELPGGGIDTIEADVTLTLPDQIENLTLTGIGAIDGTGSDVSNVLIGNEASNTLRGLAGGDTLDGGAGADQLIGGTGDDRYIVDNSNDVVVEARDEGADLLIASVDYTLPDHVETIAASGAQGVTLRGNGGANFLIDDAGDNTLDGSAGMDTAIFDFNFADATFGYTDGAFLVHAAGGTDRLLNIEVVRFRDQTISFDDIVESVFPAQDINLFAGDRYETDYPIDMSPEGGGGQFIYFNTNSQGSNQNRFYFKTEFLNGRGKAFYEGSNMLNPAQAVVNSFQVDFSGGNTTQLSISGFSKPLHTMLDADWDYFQIAIFGGDDRITGSYYDDHLVGYRGDDIIFGGLGDKEGYNVNGSTPSNVPSTLRNPGASVANPAFYVDDGDDVIDGREGNDQIDGGTGNDRLFGGSGDDQLWGGGDGGNDYLDGGEGDDQLTGGPGSDTFAITAAMGHDTVTDFVVGVDQIDLTGLDSQDLATLARTTSGNDTVYTLGDGSSLTLLGAVFVNNAATGVVQISGSVAQGATLTASNTLADLDGLGEIRYQWQRAGVDIPGATGDSYLPTQADVSAQLSVTASYTDQEGTAERVTSAATAPVANVNDLPSGLVRISGRPVQGETLTASNTLADSDGLGAVIYQWLRGGAAIPDAVAPEYLLQQADVGESLSVVASYTDGFGYAESVESPDTALVTPDMVETPDIVEIPGSVGDDLLIVELGNNVVVNGGEGIDTVRLPLFLTEFSVQEMIGGKVTGLLADEWSVELNDIEFLEFGTVHVTTLPIEEIVSGRAQDQVEKLSDLYLAMFGRAPDIGGLEFYQEKLLELGRSFSDISQDFAFSPEAQALYPASASNREFVRKIYNNAFDREPEPGGWDFWTDRLDAIPSASLNERGIFVGSVILGAYAETSAPSDRELLINRHEVSLYYVNKLLVEPDEGYDQSMTDLLALVTGDEATQTAAEAIIDYVFQDPIKLNGVMTDQGALDSFFNV